MQVGCQPFWFKSMPKQKKGNNLLGPFVKYVPFLPTCRLMSVASQWVHSFAVLISMNPKIDPKKNHPADISYTFCFLMTSVKDVMPVVWTFKPEVT